MTTKEFEEKESPISDELRTLLREQDVLYYHYWNKLYDNLQLPDTKEIDFGKGCTAIEQAKRVIESVQELTLKVRNWYSSAVSAWDHGTTKSALTFRITANAFSSELVHKYMHAEKQVLYLEALIEEHRANEAVKKAKDRLEPKEPLPF